MPGRQLPRILGAFLLCLAVYGFSNDRGSAKVELGDGKLEAFVAAAAAVDRVMATWQPKIIGAEDSQAETLRDRANTEIRESIEKVEGISFAEYRMIREAITTDPDMLARVTEIMRRQR